jgi:methionine-rich copper-binding protein CopC
MSARRVAPWAAACLAALVTVLIGSAAGAVPLPTHARLHGSTPAPGSVLPQAPAAVVLSFNRDIAPPATVVVTAPDGDRAGTGDPVVHGHDVSAPVAAQDKGTYAVAFRAVSVDGHPITGRFTFSVGHRTTPPGTGKEAAGGPGWWPWVAGLGAGAAVGLGLFRWRRRATARGDVRFR